MTPLLEIAGWSLIHFVWQGCAIAAGAAIALRLTERRAAAVRYALAGAGLALMVAAPIVTGRALWLGAGSTSTEQSGIRADVRAGSRDGFAIHLRRGEATTPDATLGAIARRSPGGDLMPVSNLAVVDRLAPAVTVVWLFGVALLLVRMLGGIWHVQRLHRSAMQAYPSRWQSVCRRLAYYRLGLSAAAHVVESSLVDVPTVVGWLRPAILLPVAALAVLTPAQVEALLAHELAHIRRHDYLVNVLQTLAETLLFYHPAVWWMSGRIRAEREHCCDEIAVALCGDAVGYARALAELEGWRSGSARLAMAATGGPLLDRVRRILQVPPTDEPRSPGWVMTLALTLLFIVAAGGVQLRWLTLRSDARAQSVHQDPDRSLAPGIGVGSARDVDDGISGGLANGVASGVAGGIGAGIADGVARGIDDGIAGGVQVPEPPAPPALPQAPEPPDPPSAPPAPPAPPARPAPPAPAAPPAPPAPPAPSAPPASPASSSRNEMHMQWSENSRRVDVTLHGSIVFKDDLTDVQSLSDDGYLKLRDWSHLIPYTIEIRSAGGSLSHTSVHRRIVLSVERRSPTMVVEPAAGVGAPVWPGRRIASEIDSPERRRQRRAGRSRAARRRLRAACVPHGAGGSGAPRRRRSPAGHSGGSPADDVRLRSTPGPHDHRGSPHLGREFAGGVCRSLVGDAVRLRSTSGAARRDEESRCNSRQRRPDAGGRAHQVGLRQARRSERVGRWRTHDRRRQAIPARGRRRGEVQLRSRSGPRGVRTQRTASTRPRANPSSMPCAPCRRITSGGVCCQSSGRSGRSARMCCSRCSRRPGRSPPTTTAPKPCWRCCAAGH